MFLFRFIRRESMSMTRIEHAHCAVYIGEFVMAMISCGEKVNDKERDDADKYNPADGILAFIPVSNGDYSYTVSLVNYDNGKVYMMPLEGVNFNEELSITVLGVDVYRSSMADTSLHARITDLGTLYVGIKENFIGYPNDVEIKTMRNIKNSSFEAIRDERISALPVSHMTFAAEKLK